MALVQPGLFHRLGLAVGDLGTADAWYRRVLGCVPVSGTGGVTTDHPGSVLDAEGASSSLLWHGGVPLILLGAATPDGVVGRFLARWGAGLHSVAWEIEDMWTTEHRLRQRDIRITGVNVPGRHFFMHPADTDGVLMEWTDTWMADDPRRGEPPPGEGPGVVGGVRGVAWITSVVRDADATAELLADLAAGERVDGNPANSPALERTIDVRVGDVTMRLVTPRTEASRYWPVLERGPRLWSYAVRVPDLDAASDGLAGEGVKVVDRIDGLVWTDPATTLGVPIEWTDSP